MASTRNLPLRCASPTLRALFQEADQQGTSSRALANGVGVSTVALCKWRRGINTPSIMTAEEVAEVIGYRLALIPVDMDFILVPKGAQFRRYAR